MEAATNFNELDSQLKDSNWFGGDLPNAKDLQVWGKIGDSQPDKAQHLNLWTWWTLVSFFTQQARNSWSKASSSGGKGGKDQQQKGGKKGKKQEKKEEKKQDEEDELGLFDDDEDEQTAKELQAQKKKMEAEKAGKKKPPPGKSMIIFDVKPWEADQDMDELAKKVLKIEMDGLKWGQDYKLEPIAFGVKKLVVVCTILDDLVSTDDLQDAITAFQDQVQSVDIQAFNKI